MSFKSGFVAIIGRPNVGKSTLLNQVVGQKISAISNKPQTTRDKISFIYTDEDAQIVFLDTPGIQTPKNKLGKYMLKTSESSLSEADVITYIVDTSNYIGRLDSQIIEILKKIEDIPIILLINKIDTIQKEKILEIIEMYSEIGIFKEIIPISAMKSDGIDIYIDSLKKFLPEGPMYYPEEMVTDSSEKFIVSELIREKTLRFIDEEIPHGVAVSIEKMKLRENQDLMDIDAIIYLEREAHKKIVIGKDGQMLKKNRKCSQRRYRGIIASKSKFKSVGQS